MHMKLKTLLPSLKEKKRYIAFQVLSEKPVEYSKAKESIKSAMQLLVGEIGLAKAGLMFLPDWEDNSGIMRVATSSVNEAKAALAFVREIDGQKAVVKSIGVSGILNKTRQNFIGG